MSGIETGAFGALALLILVVAVLVIVLYLIPVRIWIAAFASGAYVGLFTLVGMRLRELYEEGRGVKIANPKGNLV